MAHVMPDEKLAKFLHRYLEKNGYKAFIDRELQSGAKWVEETERQINASRFFIVLLSKESVKSNYVRQEVKTAHKLEINPKKEVLLLPIRVQFENDLPYDLGAFLDHIQYISWESNIGFEIIGKQVLVDCSLINIAF